MFFKKIKKVYMIGIKGVGMTMLAQFLVSKGVEVIGSDIDEEFMTDKVLKANNIKVFKDFNIENIPSNVDIIVYSGAYNTKTNEELAYIEEKELKKITYAECIGKIFNEHYGVGIIGTHGKTTTTAWLGYVLNESGINPSVLVGANVPQFKGNAIINDSKYLVAELDEYQNKLQYTKPKIALLNNVEYDHPDFFKTERDYTEVFLNVLGKMGAKDRVIANLDDETIKNTILPNINAQAITYSLSNTKANYLATDIRIINGKQRFKVMQSDQDLGEFSIALFGKHNISNALAVIATSIEMGVDLNLVRKYIEKFIGTERRMQVVGKYNNALIMDDYAHHPTEVKVTLDAAREIYKNNRLVVVFHPHTFSRTKYFLNEFIKSFKKADELVLLEIYGSAREKSGGIDSERLALEIKSFNRKNNINQKVSYTPELNDAQKHLKQTLSKNDVAILMGAGDVFRIGEKLIKKT